MPPQPSTRSIVLVGPPASGKTSVGLHLSRMLGLPLVELDSVIAGLPHRSLKSEADWEALAAEQAKALAQILRGSQKIILSRETILLSDRARKILEGNATTVALNTRDIEDLVIAKEHRNIPRKSYDRAISLFRNRADIIVGGSGRPADIADIIVRQLGYLSKEEVEKQITKNARKTPKFGAIGGKIRLTESSAEGNFRERKSEVIRRCNTLSDMMFNKGNQQPELNAVVAEYSSALRALRENNGIYRLYLAGLDIEGLVRIKSNIPHNSDTNLPFDLQTLRAIETLVISHAGLVVLFPDINGISHELDEYRQQSQGIEALRSRVLDRAMSKLAEMEQLFDKKTSDITQRISKLDALVEENGSVQRINATATKHGWLRGTLAAIGQFLLQQLGGISKAARDAVVKDAISASITHRSQLVDISLRFLHQSISLLGDLASTTPKCVWLAYDAPDLFRIAMSVLAQPRPIPAEFRG